MAAPRRTREDDLALRRSRRQTLLAGGGILLAGGLGAVGYFGLHLGALDRPLLVAFGGGCTVLGLAMVLLGSRIRVAEDSALPAFEELPPDDPRRSVPLAQRRRDWVIGAGMWAAGWVLLVLAWLGPVGELEGLPKLVAMLGLPWLGVAAGAWWQRTRTGSTSWPQR